MQVDSDRPRKHHAPEQKPVWSETVVPGGADRLFTALDLSRVLFPGTLFCAAPALCRFACDGK